MNYLYSYSVRTCERDPLERVEYLWEHLYVPLAPGVEVLPAALQDGEEDVGRVEARQEDQEDVEAVAQLLPAWPGVKKSRER